MHQSRHAVRLLVPGNGFGKSRAIGTEVAWWITKEHPYQPVPSWPCVALWFCPDYRQWQMKLPEYEAEWLPAGGKWDDQDKSYEWSSGAKLFVLSYERSWKSSQGINPDLVAFDEEPPLQLWREMRMRRRGWKKTRFLIGATATGGDSWMEKELYQPWVKAHAEKGMSVEQARLAQLHGDIWVWDVGGIDDNPGADQEDREFYHRSTWSSAAEKRVRLRGGFASFNASPVFDPDGVERLKARAAADGNAGTESSLVSIAAEDLADIELEPDEPISGVAGLPVLSLPPQELIVRSVGVIDVPMPNGRLVVYELPRRYGAAYGVGADFAYGLVDGDKDAATVLVRDDAGEREAASLYGNFGEVFDRLLWSLCVWYDGFLVGESQVGLASLRRLWSEYRYRRIYYRRHEEKVNRPRTDLLGHPRTHDDLVLDEARIAVRGGTVLLRTPELIAQIERLRFQKPKSADDPDAPARDEKLSIGLPGGESPDMVMGFSYALKALREAPHFPREPKREYGRDTLGHVLGHHLLDGGNAQSAPTWITRPK